MEVAELFTKKGVRVLVDIEDLELVVQFGWGISSHGYVRRGDSDRCYLHRMILGYSGNLHIDHINGDKLDNRKDNLRIVSNGLNQINKTEPQSNNIVGLRGVSRRRNGGYRAKVFKNGRRFMGLTRKSAEEAYDDYLTMKDKLYPCFKIGN